MSTETNLTKLNIHYLTQAQYDAATIDPNALYFISDSPELQPASDTSASLTTGGWSGSSAPYTQSVSITGMTSSKKIFVRIAESATAAERATARAALLMCTSQATGSITITADGTKPDINIPIVVREVS